ncbi:uncharacterized protein LOC122244177 [Penaeus japonicus]|uniref:uncharacterized protein LOC122244177 n=1 Tax=Penaeus japonicus TaxID=27405 RepID=UPI001C711136|nr:uncharacterized protein LOC122244177 [Penaeus japonicus]
MKPLIILVFVVGVATASRGKDSHEDAGKILAVYSQTTSISFSTSITTVPYTCARYFATTVCQKRRFRRVPSDIELSDAAEQLGSVALESTLGDTLDDDTASDALREQRLALTIWSTSSSTYTITSTSTNSSTTFSLSYYCSVVGANFAPSC